MCVKKSKTATLTDKKFVYWSNSFWCLKNKLYSRVFSDSVVLVSVKFLINREKHLYPSSVKSNTEHTCWFKNDTPHCDWSIIEKLIILIITAQSVLNCGRQKPELKNFKNGRSDSCHHVKWTIRKITWPLCNTYEHRNRLILFRWLPWWESSPLAESPHSLGRHFWTVASRLS